MPDEQEPKEAEVKGTFWMLQKKDYHPTFNEWFRQTFVDWCKERGWPLDISYIAGYTGGTPEIEKIILFGSVAVPLKKEVPRFLPCRRFA